MSNVRRYYINIGRYSRYRTIIGGKVLGFRDGKSVAREKLLIQTLYNFKK